MSSGSPGSGSSPAGSSSGVGGAPGAALISIFKRKVSGSNRLMREMAAKEEEMQKLREDAAEAKRHRDTDRQEQEEVRRQAREDREAAERAAERAEDAEKRAAAEAKEAEGRMRRAREAATKMEARLKSLECVAEGQRAELEAKKSHERELLEMVAGLERRLEEAEGAVKKLEEEKRALEQQQELREMANDVRMMEDFMGSQDIKMDDEDEDDEDSEDEEGRREAFLAEMRPSGEGQSSSVTAMEDEPAPVQVGREVQDAQKSIAVVPLSDLTSESSTTAKEALEGVPISESRKSGSPRKEQLKSAVLFKNLPKPTDIVIKKCASKRLADGSPPRAEDSKNISDRSGDDKDKETFMSPSARLLQARRKEMEEMEAAFGERLEEEEISTSERENNSPSNPRRRKENHQEQQPDLPREEAVAILRRASPQKQPDKISETVKRLKEERDNPGRAAQKKPPAPLRPKLASSESAAVPTEEKMKASLAKAASAFLLGSRPKRSAFGSPGGGSDGESEASKLKRARLTRSAGTQQTKASDSKGNPPPVSKLKVNQSSDPVSNVLYQEDVATAKDSSLPSKPVAEPEEENRLDRACSTGFDVDDREEVSSEKEARKPGDLDQGEVLRQRDPAGVDYLEQGGNVVGSLASVLAQARAEPSVTEDSAPEQLQQPPPGKLPKDTESGDQVAVPEVEVKSGGADNDKGTEPEKRAEPSRPALSSANTRILEPTFLETMFLDYQERHLVKKEALARRREAGAKNRERDLNISTIKIQLGRYESMTCMSNTLD